MNDSLKNLFTVSDLRKRVFFTLGLLAVYRVGHVITIPGVSLTALEAFAELAPASLDGDWARFGAAEFGVAPGQAAVFYDGTRLLDGGWVAETRPAEAKLDSAAAV